MPDLNSVPPSPRALASSPYMPYMPPSRSRRASQQMGPPPLPLSPAAVNVLPSNQNAVNQATQPMVSPGSNGVLATTQPGDNTGVGTGPGPLRHPRPLTAADLHLQLEKEQEAVVSSSHISPTSHFSFPISHTPFTAKEDFLTDPLQVNRLTRELSLLRAAQNASVASSTSSTTPSTGAAGAPFTSGGLGGGLPDPHDSTYTNHLLSGPSHPAPSQRRHHRSSSSTSTRSNTATSISGWTIAGIAGGIGGGIAPSMTTDRSRPGVGRQDSSSMPLQSLSLSRQNSVTSSRRSGDSSPALVVGSNPSSYHHADYFPSSHSTSHSVSQRPSMSIYRDPSFSGSGSQTIPESERQLPGTLAAMTSVQTTGRYEEAAFHRHELDVVKRENEALKRRIRELERTLREMGGRIRSESVSMGQGMGRNGRSESVSTTASAVGRREEDAVSVGESARGGG
jgi:hypothetical protein